MKNQQTSVPIQPIANKGLGELAPREIELIKRIRYLYRYGRYALVTHDGIPQRLEEKVIYDDLSIPLEQLLKTRAKFDDLSTGDFRESVDTEKPGSIL